MIRRAAPRSLAAAALALLGACSGGDHVSSAAPAAPSSLSRIQSQLFDRSCVSCHTPSSSTFAQSRLDLRAETSWAALVNVTPSNAVAANDGLLRVTPGDPDRSLLYHKVVWDAGHHAHDYGAPMPLGPDALTVGQVEYVRRWIESGAPRTGDAIDTSLLADATKQSGATFVSLPAPAAGQGFQLKIDPFSISANFERELFVYRGVGNASEVYVNRIETRMRPGSHHFVIYSMADNAPPLVIPRRDAVRDIRNADGSMNLANMIAMAYHVFFAGAMSQSVDISFPAGVALRLSPNAALDANVHYVNGTTGAITGEAYANLYTVPVAQVKNVARPINLGNTDLVLPPRQRTTVTKSFAVTDSAMRIVLLTSHMHRHGERFVIKVRGGVEDGQVLYSTTEWQHPAVLTFDTPIVLRRGQSLVSEITYYNEGDVTLRFGLTSEDEMGIIFGYFY